MAIHEILLETRLWERRAAAFSAGRPLALFHDSQLVARGPRLGTRHDVVLRERPGGLDGGFCTTEDGNDVFVRLGKAAPPALGSRFTIEVVAEARGGKLARGRRARGDAAGETDDLFKAWRGRFGRGVPVVEAHAVGDSERLDEAFDEALATAVTLEGGGRLGISRTPALTAMDIDTSGRTSRSGRGVLARAVNEEAASEAGRQAALRGLGGLIVLDCVAPVSKGDGASIKAAFLEAFRAVSQRKAEALAPSPFGLMEASLAWGECPVDEFLGDGRGGLSPVGQLLEGLRLLERETRARPAASLTLALPDEAWKALHSLPFGPAALADRFAKALGPALQFEVSPAGRVEVVRR